MGLFSWKYTADKYAERTGSSSSGGGYMSTGGTRRDGCAFALVGLGCLATVVFCVIHEALRPRAELVKTEVVSVEITFVDPPLFVEINLNDVKTGEGKRIGLGKFYANWQQDLIVGRRLTVTRNTWKLGDDQFYDWPDLREKLRQPSPEAKVPAQTE